MGIGAITLRMCARMASRPWKVPNPVSTQIPSSLCRSAQPLQSSRSPTAMKLRHASSTSLREKIIDLDLLGEGCGSPADLDHDRGEPARLLAAVDPCMVRPALHDRISGLEEPFVAVVELQADLTGDDRDEVDRVRLMHSVLRPLLLRPVRARLRVLRRDLHDAELRTAGPFGLELVGRHGRSVLCRGGGTHEVPDVPQEGARSIAHEETRLTIVVEVGAAIAPHAGDDRADRLIGALLHP